MPARRCGKLQPTVAREGFLDRRSKRCFWLLLSPQTKVARAGARNSPCAGCGRDEGVLRRCAATPHPPPSGAPVSLRVGRFADLTRHRRVIQRREPLKGKANGGVSFNTANPSRGRLEGAPLTPRTPSRGRLEGVRHSTPRPIKGEGLGVHHSTARSPQGEGFFRPGALLLALFIAFWRCRSSRSETGVTGRRRGLRRGRRSWENPWHRRP